MDFPYRYIAIEGNIGAGKTTLARMLAQDIGSDLILEEFEDNSFLPRFYEDPNRYAFPLEMSFLASRYNQLKKQLPEPGLFQKHIVSDYIFPKCMIFSRLNLKDDEYELYQRLFNIIHLQLPQPDILLYLHQPVERLQWNIAGRGRPYELNISDEYLKNLQEAYFEYMQSSTHLKIIFLECSSIDFVNNSEHYQAICSLLQEVYKPGIHFKTLDLA